MNIKMEDLIRAISEERIAWGNDVHDFSQAHTHKNTKYRTPSENHRDIVNMALLNVLARVTKIAEEKGA